MARDIERERQVGQLLTIAFDKWDAICRERWAMHPAHESDNVTTIQRVTGDAGEDTPHEN